MSECALRPTIIIPTRNRPDDLRRCLASVLRHRPPGCAVIVVDQSDDHQSLEVVRQLAKAAGAGFIYHRSAGRGLSLGRNEGARLAGGGLLLYSDDDCEITEFWVSTWLDLFEHNVDCGIGFGPLNAPPVDLSIGWIPSFDPGPGTSQHRFDLFLGRPDKTGWGANMVLRFSDWAATNGFDEMLGAGSSLPAGEDVDMALRVVCLGRRILHAQSPQVLHHGFRRASEASELAYLYSLGKGAVYGKHWRCRRENARLMLASVVSAHAVRVLRAVSRGERPTHFTSLRGLLAGIMRAMRTDVDVQRGLFLPQAVAAPTPSSRSV